MQKQREKGGWKTLLLIPGAIVILLAGSLCGSFAYLMPVPAVLQTLLYAVVYIGLVLALSYLLCGKFAGESLKAYRIDRSGFSLRWLVPALLLPLGVSFALTRLPGSWEVGNLSLGASLSLAGIALLGAGLSAGICEEVVFRGVLMHAVEKQFGRTAAVLVPSLLFALLHLPGSGAGLWDGLLVVVAGTGVGILFSEAAILSGSVFNGALMHGLWNVLMIGRLMDIGTGANPGALLRYTLSDSLSPLLTGGAFGVESSLFAVLGYGLAAVLIFVFRRKKKQAA